MHKEYSLSSDKLKRAPNKTTYDLDLIKMVLLKNSEVTIILQDRILLAVWESPSVDLLLAQRAVKYRVEATDYKTYPVLIDIRSIKNISKPARDFLASPAGCEGILAAAILIDSPLTSLIGNFFLNINKPLKPTRIFNNEPDAKKWLVQFLEK